MATLAWIGPPARWGAPDAYGQSSPWVLAPAPVAAALFPVAWVDDVDLPGALAGQTLVPWEEPIPSPFEAAAAFLSEPEGSCRVEVTPEPRGWQSALGDAEFFTGFDDLLFAGHATEAFIQFFFRTRVDAAATSCVFFDEAEDHQRPPCGVPIPDYAASPLDVLLYLIAIGRVPGRLPLGLAKLLKSPQFRWELRLSDFSRQPDPIAKVEVLEEGASIVEGTAATADHALVVEGRTEVLTLAGRWRRRSSPVLDGVELDDDAEAAFDNHNARRVSGLVRQGGEFVWLSADPLPPEHALLPGVVTLKHILPAINESLARRRRAPTGSVKEQSSVAECIADGIWSLYCPWPDPFELRAPTDEAWTWSPQQCRDFLAPAFDRLHRAPLVSEPSNLLATFLYLIGSRQLVCLAWPTELSEVWRFKIRTYDHSWIVGSAVLPVREQDDGKADAAISATTTSDGNERVACGQLVFTIWDVKH